MAEAAAGRGDEPRYGRILAVLAVNAAGFAFLETAVIPALPAMQKALHAHSATSTALLESAYLAVAAVMAPLLGRLGDKRGKKGPLLLALGIYLAGAVNAGFCTSIWMLVPFRALQAAGGAVLALSIAILRDRAPEERVGEGIGWLFGSFGVGIAAGFGLSGLIAQALSWRWIFWFGSMVVAANWLLVFFFVPASEPRPETRVDVAGAAVLGLAVALLIGACAFGQPAGWGSWYIVELFVLAALACWGWVHLELAREQPLLEVRVLASPRVLLPNLGALLSGFAAFSLFLMVPRFVHAPRGLPHALGAQLGYGFGATESQLGLFLLPVGLGVAVGAPLGGAIGRRWTGKWPFVAGLALLGLAALFMVILAGHVLEVLAWMLLAGLGFGASAGASAAFVTEAVPAEQVGVANAFNSLVRLVGGGVGSEVASAIFSANLVRGHGALASACTHGALDAVFWIAFGMSVLGAVLVSFVPAGREGGKRPARRASSDAGASASGWGAREARA